MSYNPNLPTQNWLEPYVRQVSDQFGLGNWAIRLYTDNPDIVDAIACVKPIYGRALAELRVSDTFWVASAEEQRATVLHELLHCHFAQPQHWCRSQMKYFIHEAFVLMHENSIDAVAQAIAPFFPLPPLPEPPSLSG